MAAALGPCWVPPPPSLRLGLRSARRPFAHSEWKLRQRESLYKEFITEAPRLTIDALAHCLERPDQLMALYGILSRIRLISGEEVLRQGEACCRRIIELYGRPNLTADQIPQSPRPMTSMTSTRSRSSAPLVGTNYWQRDGDRSHILQRGERWQRSKSASLVGTECRCVIRRQVVIKKIQCQ